MTVPATDKLPDIHASPTTSNAVSAAEVVPIPIFLEVLIPETSYLHVPAAPTVTSPNLNFLFASDPV